VLDKLPVDNEDEATGVKVLRASLDQPIRWLAKNSGADDGWVVRKVLDSAKSDEGFNALTLQFGSMIEQGILDPVKVTRSALINAASVASMILTTEALVADKETEEKKNSLPGGGMGMDM
jgi:chaperonin GroEL